MPKYSKTHRCDLCGFNYAVLSSTWHISKSYRKHFCEQCTTILMLMVEKVKKAMKP